MKLNKNLLPISIFFSALIVAGALVYNAERTSGNSNRLLSRKDTSIDVLDTKPEPPAPVEPQGTVVSKVSIDDDPVIGDSNAPITIIEFLDYECPFCKRSAQEMIPQLMKEYVDTGKVKLVFRDIPLSFHDPLATQEAIAAECSRDQGGDEVYLKYHDEIFDRTNSNGNGMSKDELYKIAADLELNTDSFATCLDTEKYKEEVQKDVANASEAGATATPTYYIGKSTEDGIVEGTQIVGAQPYAVFKAEIDRLLSE